MFNSANLPFSLLSRLFCPSFSFLLILIAQPARAQEQPSAQPDAADASVQFISAFFTADTVAVADIDLTAIDPEAISSWLQENAGADPAAVAAGVQIVSGTLVTLRGAGVEHVYAVAMQQDLPTAGAALLIPCNQPDTVAGLLAAAAGAIPKQFEYQVHREDGLVVLAPPSTWERIQKRPAVERPELTRALQSISDLPHRLAVALPERVRAEVAELWPDRLPQEVPLEVSPRELMRDFRAKAIGWRLPPEPRLTVRVITADAEAAERVAEATGKLLKIAAAVLPKPQVTVENDQVVVAFDEQDFQVAFKQITGAGNLTRGRMQDSNQMKQIGLAFHNYHDTYGHLPPRATANAEGQMLLSWRVMILPFIEQFAFYNQLHLDEPWDSEHNIRFAETIPVTYVVSGPALPPGHTRIRLPQIEGSLWAGDGPPRKFQDVTDGLSNTIGAAIAPPSAAVAWSKPEPWQLDESNLLESFFGDQQSTIVMLLDGSVRTLPRTIGAETLRAMLTHQGGEAFEFPEN